MDVQKAKDEYIDWLRDAHAMEMQAAKLLNTQISRLEHYPAMRAKCREHLEQTKRQAQMLETCLKAHGTDTSTIKDAMGKSTAMMQALGGVFASDEVVKSGIACYTFENMEIASYQVLIGAAKHFGDEETARVCTQILKEEEAMADWLKANIPATTADYLTKEAAEATSSH